MILFDTETTGLVEPEAIPLVSQPYIIEMALLKLDDATLETVSTFETLCKVDVPIPEIVTKSTRITAETLVDAYPFSAYYQELVELCLGERYMVAHNLQFDITMLKLELMRMGKLTSFPYPPVQLCTVEASLSLKGFRLNLGALHELATGAPHTGAHGALADCQAMATCVRWLAGKGLLPFKVAKANKKKLK